MRLFRWMILIFRESQKWRTSRLKRSICCANASSDYTDGIADYKYFTRVFGDLDQLQGSDKDPEALVLDLKEKKSAIPAIYMACGTEDFLLDVNRRFHDFLVSEQVGHTYVESQGGHTWDFWNEYIEKALLWAIQ
ncbi:hypothetical protein AB4Z22_13625 [Paenibacillus sp. TAF58]